MYMFICNVNFMHLQNEYIKMTTSYDVSTMNPKFTV